MIDRIAEPAAQIVAGDIERHLLQALGSINAQARNETIVLVERDGDGRLIAGLTGATSYGWLLIKVLWVDDGYRARGIGRQMLLRAEDIARDYGCHAAWLDTSNPAAHAFYSKAGYVVFGQLHNGPETVPTGHTRWFMRKDLRLPASEP